MSNVVHEYFKKQFDGFKVIVQLNPVDFTGVELTIPDKGNIEKRELTFDENIYEDLKVDEFEQASPIEFNLYIKGLVSQ